MSRIISLAAAFALFAGASVLAQNSDTSSAPAPAAPPAASSDAGAAPADSSQTAPKAGMHHHHRHGGQMRNSSSTDNDADKLNSCQVNANPTPEQEQCLHQAENSPS